MKVLMFGWEFPPHISGGLGTACYGLTQSLVTKNVNVLFVVPTLHGDEPAGQVSLINASSTIIPYEDTDENERGKKPSEIRVSENPINGLTQEDVNGIVQKEVNNITYIEVPAALSPYQSALPVQSVGIEEKSWVIEHWNYQFPESTLESGSDEQKQEPEKKKRGISYSFSGTYGHNLLEEVNRYAMVAGQLAKEHSFDMIHAHDWMTYPAGIAAKKASGKPLIIHVHATEFDRSGENVNKHVYALELQGMQEADRIIAVSQWTKDILVKRYNVPEEKVSVVHNGIIPKTLAPPFTPPPIGSHIVTFLGRVTHQKGPQYFVEAARKVLQKFTDVHFVVVGSGDLLPHMIERVAQLRMSSRFHFTGFLQGDLIDKVWSISNVYVMPSVSEPFGIAPLEAVQSGVPVIVSRQSGVAEVMPHFITADFWDIDALAGAICSVLQYKSLSRTLQKNGVKEVKNLTWDNAAEKINTIYNELIAQD